MVKLRNKRHTEKKLAKKVPGVRKHSFGENTISTFS